MAVAGDELSWAQCKHQSRLTSAHALHTALATLSLLHPHPASPHPQGLVQVCLC